MYIGCGGVAYSSWEGRPPCRPLPMREPLTGLSAPEDIPDCHVISKVPALMTKSISHKVHGAHKGQDS